MRLNLSKKLVVSIGFVLLIFFVYSTVNIFAGEWLISKIDNLAYGYFRIGSVEGISLNREVEEEINLSADEHFELFTNINDANYDMLASAVQRHVEAYPFSSGINNENYQASGIGKLVFIKYDLSYIGQDSSVAAYVRLKPNSNIGNEVIIDGTGTACYQYVFYMDGSYPVQLSRIGFYEEADSYYYYPKPIQNGDTVKLVYALYFPGDINLPYNTSCLDLQLEGIYAQNNFAEMDWNISFNGNAAEPFESAMSVPIPYNSFQVFIQAPVYLEEFVPEEVVSEEELIPVEEIVPPEETIVPDEPNGEAEQTDDVQEQEQVNETSTPETSEPAETSETTEAVQNSGESSDE